MKNSTPIPSINIDILRTGYYPRLSETLVRKLIWSSLSIQFITRIPSMKSRKEKHQTYRCSSRSVNEGVDSTSNVIMHHCRNGGNIKTSGCDISTNNNHAFLWVSERFDCLETGSLRNSTKRKHTYVRNFFSKSDSKQFRINSVSCRVGSEIVHINPHGHSHCCHFDEQ